MTNIGQNIRKIRTLRGLKQDFMAQALHISLNSYGKIERNEVSLRISRLTQIAEILNTSVAKIITFDEHDFFV